MTIHDVSRVPRPRRMVDWLKADYDVTLVGPGQYNDPAVRHLPLAAVPRTRRHRWRYGMLTFLRAPAALDCPPYSDVEAILRGEQFDLIVSHDLLLLPMVERLRGHATTVFDAREFYPGHYAHDWRWRWRLGRFNTMLCRRFMPRMDLNVSVCDGVAGRLMDETGARVEVLESWPEYHELSPGPVDPAHIRLLHHGSPSRPRCLERMIHMMDYLDERYTLDMVLVEGDAGYLDFLRAEAATRPRVRILPAVPFSDLVPFGNRYDIGVFLVPPTTPNLEMTLPNKFFEFIQSRLAVAIGPSPEMSRYVNAGDLGVVATDFSPPAMAAAIAGLDAEAIAACKRNADTLARQLHATAARQRFFTLLAATRGRQS